MTIFTMKNKIKKTIGLIFALLLWLGVWYLLAKKADLTLILPTPKTVFQRLFELLGEGQFYKAAGASFLRVMWGFTLGTVLGFALGFCANLLPFLRTLFEPIMSVLRATPVASFILVLLFWTKTERVPAVISFMMVLPIIFQNTLTGFDSRDRAFDELKKAFRIFPLRCFFKVDLPQVLPYVFSAGKTALGLAWKAGVAAEVLALPKVSVGYMIYNAKMYLETVDLYAYTLAIILISILLEKLVEKIFSGRRWDCA